jgi:murein DD-endopeptidase MepM/ murein hydrolase activator NlpD
MPSHNQDFLDKRYISNTDIDINAMMSSVTGETIDGTFLELRDKIILDNKEVYLGRNTGINNHTIFAQNMVKETVTGKFFKSAQTFLRGIECESNTGLLDFSFLRTAFKTTQGLVELPIHTILKIGGIYDFYYYNDYEKDSKIDLDIVNGLKTNNGYDLFDDPIIKNKHYGTYVFDDKNLVLATAPFVKPITPRHIDDSIGNGSDSFSKTNISKNYKEKYYDYNYGLELSLNNNISSHMPFSGYGVLNNYMNSMSHFFFGEGLDGGTDITDTRNNNGIPYHIIGNFKGNLKTFKTYNDTQLNFLASYNNFGTKIQHDLNGLKTTLDTLTKTITLDTNFVFSKSPKKTEFFLILSKIKANYLGGYISTDYLITIIKDLCTINNLNAKNGNTNLSDFAALLIHLLFYPDGAEKDNRRSNKTYRILSLYDVDPNSFMNVVEYETNILYTTIDFLLFILGETQEKQHEQVSKLLLSLWAKEFNTEKSSRLSSVDKQGTYVVYPSCGGEINIKELFSNEYYTYHKTNNVSTFIETADLTNSYVTGLTTSSFTNYDDINNDTLNNLNFDYKTFYGNLPNNISINNPYTDFLDIKGLADTLKYSQKGTVPNSIPDNDNLFLGRYDQSLYGLGLITTNITNPMVTSNLDRYDDLYIIANTTNPAAIKELDFDNRLIINNTSKLFWFDRSRDIFPETETFRSQKGEHLKDIKIIDSYETLQYGYGDDVRQLYEWVSQPVSDTYAPDDGTRIPDLTIHDYSKFEKDKYYYLPSDTSNIDPLIDIFGVDKLEDFRALFKNFVDKDTKNYFTEAFNTFNFQSLIKHTNIFGYTHLPDSVTLDRAYTKEEISAFLCGYSGDFIEFASKNDVSKIINYALTIGQENKAKIVIDEFMNAKITINNYSTTGPLYVDNTSDNPEGLRLNSNIFNPIIMYASETRTPDNIISKIDYRLLFRTLLFGDQPIKPYDVKTIPDNFNILVDKYLGGKELVSVEPTLEKILLQELTRIFFSTLNIEITEGNLKLLLTYLKSYINNLGSPLVSSVGGYNIAGLKYIFNRNATIFPSTDGYVDREYDGTIGNYIITNEIINGVFTKVGEVKYLYNNIDDLKPVEKLKEFIDYTNKNILTKQIEAFNTGLEKFSNLTKSKIDGLGKLKDSESVDEYDETLDKGKIEARTGTYYRIKTLYDRSVSFNNIDLNDSTLIKKTSKDLAKIDVNTILNHPLFFNFNVETDDNDYENCNDKKITADKNGDNLLKDLYDYALVLDRGNNPYGSKVLANIDALKKVIADDLQNATQVDNTLRSKSMWSVLSTLASDHEFLLLPLTSYVNLNGAVAQSKDPFELAHDMFGVFNNLEMFDSNPAFIFQLGSLTSNVSAGNKQKKNSLSEFDLSNTFCMDIETNQLGPDGMGKILDEGIPNDIVNSSVSSFIVDFGNKNQNMFQNIQLSTDEFANTEESIFAQVQLTSKDNVAQLSTGKLFTAMENRSYSCTVTSLGNASIQPLTYFYVKNVPLFYGTYWITNVSHKITPNNMTTTFKGVRQPISKKPTANISIIQQLLKTALANTEAAGFLDPNNRIPTPTSGPVYAYDRTKTEYGIFSQATTANTSQYVNYDGLWITAAYLHLMTNGDQNNKLLIKALIAYLYNNASLLEGSSSKPTEAIKHFADVVLYDMFVKLGIGTSLYDLLNAHPTTNTAYEEILSEFAKTTTEADKNVFKFLEHDQPLKGIKTTLITSDTDGVVANDAAKAKITYPSDIGIPSTSKSDFIGSSYWVSDKPANNFNELQGFSRYRLTNDLFKTKGSRMPGKSGSVTEKYTPIFVESNGLPPRIFVNGLKFQSSLEMIVEVYTPYITTDGYPYITTDDNGVGNFGVYKKIGTYNTYKTGYLATKIDPFVLTLLKTNPDDRLVDFDAKSIPGIKPGEKYFAVVKYLDSATNKYKGIDARGVSGLGYQINNNLFDNKPGYVGNNPGADPYFNVTSAENNSPVVLGFGSTTGTTLSQNTNGKFIYNASFGDPYTPTGEATGSTQYQADVLGAISDGKSYISFIGIALQSDRNDQILTSAREVRSYVSKDVLGTKEKPKDWTIVDKDIKSDQIYKPEIKKSSNGKKTKVSGWVDPLKSIKISSDYGDRILDGKPDFHRGIDLKASIGTPVFSVLPGKVVYAGDSSGYGQVVIIAHQDNGISTLYGHVSEILTSAGATVKAGDIIAKSGNLGKSTGPHLHFEIRKVVATDKNSYFAINKDGDENPESYLSYKGASPDVKTVTSTEIEANKVEIKNYLKDRGWSKYEVAAALGNIHKETGNTFNPLIQSGADVINGKNNVGLIQWNNKTFDTVGSTVDAQMNYLVEGGWKGNTDRFRAQLKAEIPTIKQDLSVAGSNVTGLSSDELQAYVAAYVFAWKVEVCFNCNVGWAKYHITEKGISPSDRSKFAVDYFKRMNNSSDKLKW